MVFILDGLNLRLGSMWARPNGSRVRGYEVGENESENNNTYYQENGVDTTLNCIGHKTQFYASSFLISPIEASAC